MATTTKTTSTLSKISPKVKPALTKHPHYQVSTNKNKNERKKKKVLSWDEHAIEEHDQLRGTRMKIDEPKTPFTHYALDGHHMDEGDEISVKSHSPSDHEKNTSKLCWETLEKKLEHVAANRQRSSSISSISSKEEESLSEFKKKRSKHYNEMEMVRKFRLENNIEDEDEDCED